MPAAARVYAEQLLPRGHGLPLWEPEPTELGEVEIGDVGLIDEGGFCRIFNTTRHKDDPTNVFGVPEGFSPLEYNERALRHTSIDYLLPGPIYSSSMRQFSIGGGPSVQGVRASYKFNCTSNQGALIVLGAHGTRSLVRKNTVFAQYMRTHRDAWLDFARALGHSIDLDDLILVSGWTKTSQWALAACTNFGRAHEVTLDASFGAIAGAKFEVKLCQDVEMSVDQRSGPSRTGKDGDEVLPRDQCLFLRYYKMKRTKFGVKKIVAGSGPRRQSSYDDTQKRSHTGVLADEHRTHSAPRQHSYDDPQTSLEEDCVEEYGVLEEIKEEPRALPQIEPLDILLDYILEYSVAEVAVVCHEDLYSICSGEWPVHLEAFLRNAAPPIHVDEHKVGTLRHHGEAAYALPRISEYSDDVETTDTLDFDSPGTVDAAPLPADGSLPHHARVEAGSAISAEAESNISTTTAHASHENSNAAAAFVPAVADRTPLDRHELLQHFRQAHERHRHRPRCASRRSSQPTWSPWSFGAHSSLPATSPPQEKVPGPDKYSTKVLCAAPLGYIVLYRACTRFTARPHLAAAHFSAGVAMGAVVYGKRRQDKGGNTPYSASPHSMLNSSALSQRLRPA